jgi:histidyl-tRNA synthetase
VVRINNRKVLNGVMENAGIADDDAHVRGIVLRAIDKLDRLGVEGMRALLGEGRMDESGDYTEGAGLAEEQIEAISLFANAKENLVKNLEETATKWDRGRNPTGGRLLHGQAHYIQTGQNSAFNPLIGLFANDYSVSFLRDLVGSSRVGNEGVNELEQIAAHLEAQNYNPGRIVIDPSVVRGLGYYTGPVFEAELTFEVTDEKGRPRQFGSVAGGGRYDDLVTRFTGQQVPATGVSIGVDRLLAALRATGRAATPAPGPVVVTVMDRDRMADYQSICATLRQAGIRAEVYLGNPKNFGNQLKYADKRGAPAAIIQGSDEAARGVVQVKDLVLGARLAEQASVEEWKENPSQTEVALADLVPFLRDLLA